MRAMAVSTSISTLARVPSTISRRMGSTVLPSGVSRLPCSYAVGSPAGLTGVASWVGCVEADWEPTRTREAADVNDQIREEVDRVGYSLFRIGFSFSEIPED